MGRRCNIIECGVKVKAQRTPEKGGTPQWKDVDIVELSDSEFANWWQNTQSDKDKFVVANALRRACLSRSDWGDQMGL